MAKLCLAVRESILVVVVVVGVVVVVVVMADNVNSDKVGGWCNSGLFPRPSSVFVDNDKVRGWCNSRLYECHLCLLFGFVFPRSLLSSFSCADEDGTGVQSLE
jgi:hypothetical protein